MNNRIRLIVWLAALIIPLGACSPKISGTVRLLDQNLQPTVHDNLQGTVINMINISSSIENASHSVTTNAEGKFESGEDAIKPGKYKVEVSRIGYQTETLNVEIGRFSSKTLDIKLRKIEEGKRRSIEGSRSDEDKIINPGEVNIQPPEM